MKTLILVLMAARVGLMPVHAETPNKKFNPPNIVLEERDHLPSVEIGDIFEFEKLDKKLEPLGKAYTLRRMQILRECTVAQSNLSNQLDRDIRMTPWFAYNMGFWEKWRAKVLVEQDREETKKLRATAEYRSLFKTPVYEEYYQRMFDNEYLYATLERDLNAEFKKKKMLVLEKYQSNKLIAGNTSR